MCVCLCLHEFQCSHLCVFTLLAIEWINQPNSAADQCNLIVNKPSMILLSVQSVGNISYAFVLEDTPCSSCVFVCGLKAFLRNGKQAGCFKWIEKCPWRAYPTFSSLSPSPPPATPLPLTRHPSSSFSSLFCLVISRLSSLPLLRNSLFCQHLIISLLSSTSMFHPSTSINPLFSPYSLPPASPLPNPVFLLLHLP